MTGCRRWVLLLAFVLPQIVYGLTLSPGLTWAHWGADGGDFVTAALSGRMPHPPGFPLYMLLADLFVRLPLQNPAWRLNLLSSVMSSAAAFLLAWTLLIDGVSPWAALTTALSLAFSRLLWSQSVITEVYTTGAFFAAASLLWRSVDRQTRWWAGVGGLLLGLATSVHPLLIILLPLIWGAVRVPKCRLYALAGLAVGLLPYALLPLRGEWPQPWGDMRTFAGWGRVVSARLYWGYAFALPVEVWAERTLAFFRLLLAQFTPLGLWLGVRGVIHSSARRKWWIPVMLGLIGLYIIGYNTTDSLVYLTLFMPLLAYWLGRGISQIAGALQGVPVSIWLLLPLVLLVWNWGAVDLSSQHAVRTWLDAVWKATPSRALLVTEVDAHTFTLWYAQTGLEQRPDVLVVDQDLWAASPAYREFLGSAEDDLRRFLDGSRPSCRLEPSGLVVCD